MCRLKRKCLTHNDVNCWMLMMLLWLMMLMILLMTLRHNEKKRSEEMQTLRDGCSNAERKISPRRRPPSPGAQDGQNLIGDGHYLYLQTQFGEDRCMQCWVIVVSDPPTNKHTNPQTGAITIRCAAASAECNDTTFKVKRSTCRGGAYRPTAQLDSDLMLLVHGVMESGYLAHWQFP